MTPFDRFWAAYPRKQAKKGARKVFARLDPTPETVEAMLDAIARTPWPSVTEYIPLPATWLNGERWLDVQEAPRPVHRDVGGNIMREWLRYYPR